MAAVANLADDPLSRVLAPLPTETVEQRAVRQNTEQIAKQISNEIDAWLSREGKKKHVVKLLLLGQAESGKSTTLKNLRLVYAADSFRKERASWPPIIHFNLLRQVVQILDLLEQALDEQEESRPSSSSENLASRQGQFTIDHRILVMRLKPLLDLESTMNRHLLQSLSRRRNEEVAVHSHFAWTKHFTRNSQTPQASVGDTLAGELHRVLNASCQDIIILWNDPLVRRLLYQQERVMEHEAGFFLDDIERVVSLNYQPTDLDVCKARLKTIGVTETHLKVRSQVGPTDWMVYDIGGSRTQRATWKPFFDDVNAIVFLAPLSAFNQTLEEMPSVNRLEDSLLLWRDISSSPLLAGAHLIVFLNKIDLLEKKLQQGIQFSSFLVGYTGTNDRDSVCKQMKKKFLAVYKDAQEKLKPSERSPSRVVRVFLTSVLDLESMRTIIIEVENSILGDNLASSSMI